MGGLERLNDADIATHAEAIAQVRAAQAVWEFWAQTLVKRYQLGPRDTISENGLIHREAAVGPS